MPVVSYHREGEQTLTAALDNPDGDALFRDQEAHADAEDKRRRTAEREAQRPVCQRGDSRSGAGRSWAHPGERRQGAWSCWHRPVSKWRRQLSRWRGCASFVPHGRYLPAASGRPYLARAGVRPALDTPGHHRRGARGAAGMGGPE
ncbi:hypothetical protein C1I97_12945 [Streptomyces sp. NTH33]|nr:hypothetical protein C1I97_12945 [Streptomyces sp. NTH33]